jgi:CheY-like chemotaxis protein/HPt (histidine-containing phosphotransfer) domain-containing protein
MLYQDLINAVAMAAGVISTTEFVSSPARLNAPQRPPAPSVLEAQQSQRLILLAEDNETNRDVMQEQLRLLGYTCEVAIDGEQALAMWQAGAAQNRYALVLSDCHMPNLDGFGLTAAIRAAEGPGTHLPIIAITANAMQGEAERCKERGMDDYLSKPLRMHELSDLLDKWLPMPSLYPIWNPGTLSELVGDNPAMHRRLLEKFLTNAQKQVAAIMAASAEHDPVSAIKEAHTLKSAARSVGALALGELCQTIEKTEHTQSAASLDALSSMAQALPAALANAANMIRQHHAF